MLIFQQHTSKNQKQVYEYKKVLQSGRQGTAPSHGGPQKQDPTSHTAGEEGESIYHFEIQLRLLFTERVWQNKTVTVNKRLCIQALEAKSNEEKKKEVTLNEVQYLDEIRLFAYIYKCSPRLLRSSLSSVGEIKEFQLISLTRKMFF